VSTFCGKREWGLRPDTQTTSPTAAWRGMNSQNARTVIERPVFGPALNAPPSLSRWKCWCFGKAFFARQTKLLVATGPSDQTAIHNGVVRSWLYWKIRIVCFLGAMRHRNEA
jgi:hypothetical protein